MRVLRVFLCLVAASSSNGCAWSEAKRADEELRQSVELEFRTIGTSGPVADRLLGLRDARIFGRDWFGVLNASVVHQEPDGSRSVTVPFWCSGWKTDGQYAKLRREFTVKGGGFSISPGTDLSSLRQILTWLFWSWIGPPLLCAFLMSVLNIYALWRWLLILTGVVALPLTLYAAFICFGTWAAALLCLGVQLLSLMVVRSIASAAAAGLSQDWRAYR
jgi:hypothetical protein